MNRTFWCVVLDGGKASMVIRELHTYPGDAFRVGFDLAEQLHGVPQLGHGLAGAAQRPRALGGRPRALLLDAGVHGARAARLLDTCHVHSRSSINALTHNYLYRPLRRLSTRRCPHSLLSAGACSTAPTGRP